MAQQTRPRRPAKAETSNVLDTDQSAGPPYFIEFIEEGMTLDGAVWRRGAVCMTDDPFGALSLHEQVAKYGRPYFQPISRQTYEELADSTVPRGSVTAAARARFTPPPAAVAPMPRLGGTPETIEATVSGGQGGDAAMEVAQAAGLLPTSAIPPQPTSMPAPWVDYDRIGVEETLDRVAAMSDEQVEQFLLYERTHLARTEVLSELGE